MAGRLAALLFLVAFVVAEDSDVVELGADDFESIDDMPIALVEFYAPW